MAKIEEGKYYVDVTDTTFTVTSALTFTTATYKYDITIDGTVVATVEHGATYTLPQLPVSKYYVGVTEKTFSPTDKYPTAFIERKDMEYSYEDGGLYYFMDPETYDMVPVDAANLGDNFKFVKENMVCKILSYKGSVFGVEPPNSVTLQVTKTDPGFAGNTATNATKPATLETGAEVKVPLFIDEGEMIVVDTRTGEYLSRA